MLILQIIPLVPLFLLDLCYGTNNGFTAILTPQLSEPCAEFNILTHQKSLIVSMDNMIAPVTAIAAGILQQKIGPKKILILCRHCSSTLRLFFSYPTHLEVSILLYP